MLGLQTFKSAEGEKTAPTIDSELNARLSEADFYQELVYGIILIIWFVQQAFFGYIGLYFISNVMQMYEKYYEMMPLLSYKTKAKFNLESF